MICPLGQKVALEIITNLDLYAKSLKKRSGLLAPKLVEGQPLAGKVLALSRDIQEPEYSVGDAVIFKTPEGSVFQGVHLDGKKVCFVNHEDIRGKLESWTY
jgi:co-chaperonin GroES (HSP10)